MKQKPILFSLEMVKAILEGRKTQTRRIIKPQPTKQAAVEKFCLEGPGSVDSSDLTAADSEMDDLYEKSPYKPGDILWVRQNWFPAAITGNKVLIGYDVSNPSDTYEIVTENVGYYWEKMDKGHIIPSIFMPYEIARIFLKVTNVREERLQDISEADAIAEGIDLSKCSGDWEHTPAQEYEALWKRINGEESWDLNPWVWVITFEKTDRP